jgi:hypothetical protein
MMDGNDSNSDSAMGPERLGRLFDRHAAVLELYARSWCECPEDVVQEAFVELVGQCPPPDDRMDARRSGMRLGDLAAGRTFCFSLVTSRSIPRLICGRLGSARVVG